MTTTLQCSEGVYGLEINTYNGVQMNTCSSDSINLESERRWGNSLQYIYYLFYRKFTSSKGLSVSTQRIFTFTESADVR